MKTKLLSIKRTLLLLTALAAPPSGLVWPGMITSKMMMMISCAHNRWKKLSDNRDEKRRKKISPFTNEDLWLNEMVIWDGFTQQLEKRDEILILKNGGTVRKTHFFLKKLES